MWGLNQMSHQPDVLLAGLPNRPCRSAARPPPPSLAGNGGAGVEEAASWSCFCQLYKGADHTNTLQPLSPGPWKGPRTYCSQQPGRCASCACSSPSPSSGRRAYVDSSHPHWGLSPPLVMVPPWHLLPVLSVYPTSDAGRRPRHFRWLPWHRLGLQPPLPVYLPCSWTDLY